MDITSLGIVGVGSITVICFLIGLIAKNTGRLDKWIPSICGAFGALLGLLWFFAGWAAFPAEEPVTAAAVGIISGLAATGAHQVYKQLTEG